MAKEKLQQETENTETTEKAKRGTSFLVQARNAFISLMSEYKSTGKIGNVTLDSLLPLFDSAPAIKGVSLPLDVQLANVEASINEIYESAVVDQNGMVLFTVEQSDKRGELIAQRDKLKKQIEKANKPATENNPA